MTLAPLTGPECLRGDTCTKVKTASFHLGQNILRGVRG